MLRLTAAVLLLSLVSGLKCPDQQRCGDQQTCCQIPSGEFNCCPFHQGECCEDHLHCCPEGMLCEVKESRCTNATHSLPWAERFPSEDTDLANVERWSVSDVTCDETKTCPDGNTCCKNEEGGWACCPLPQAVCCEDLIHCCPHDTKCNVAAESCDNSSMSVPWLKKEPSKPIGGQKVPNTKDTSVSDIPCDDTKTCPDDSTCCKTEEGEWACCPLPQAVCCEDFIHCCPHGTKCNLAAQKCDNSSGSVPWLKKEPSKPIGDQKVPETEGSVPWLKKKPSRPTASTARNTSEVTCDPHVSCPPHTTCCFMKMSKKWGCCPLDQATCCDDGENCCPKGYTCRNQWCEKSSRTKYDSVPLSSQIQNDIDCGGGFSCKDTETCCKISESSWGCCPFTEAVCCSDMEHCCPTGYTCETGSCVQATGFKWEMFFSKKKRAGTL